MQDVKRHGKHYTPSDLARFLAERVISNLPAQADIRILDPACGDGELLFAIHESARRQQPAARLSLVGYDLDPLAIEVAKIRGGEAGIDVDWHVGDFLQAERELPRRSFDVVITNPPYVRTQQLGQETAQILAASFGLKGRIDLTHPFVALLPELLRPEGVVGLLCSNRFLTTKAGANVRAIFGSALEATELYDLGDTKLFEAAVLPAIVIALNRPPATSSSCSFASAYETDAAPSSEVSLFAALLGNQDAVVRHIDRVVAVRVGALVRPVSAEEPWRLSHGAGDEWLEAIKAATWCSFGDVAKIRVGIKTTADAVFISNDWPSAHPSPEEELLCPLVTHDNVTPWRVSEHLSTRVLYPYDRGRTKRTVLDMTNFPRAMSYLETHSERLKGRQYVIDAGRAWFEIWVPQQPAMWSIPKIVFPDISVNARFALDRSGSIVNGDCYWISLSDIGDEDVALLMLAVANSRLGERYYDEVCGNKLYAGRRRWMTQYVARLPLPDPRAEASRELIRATKEFIDGVEEPSVDQLALLDTLVEAAFAEPCPTRSKPPDLLF